MLVCGLRAFLSVCRVVAYSMDHCGTRQTLGMALASRNSGQVLTKVGVSLGTQEMKTILFL
jgi:hypothetical protein